MSKTQCKHGFGDGCNWCASDAMIAAGTLVIPADRAHIRADALHELMTKPYCHVCGAPYPKVHPHVWRVGAQHGNWIPIWLVTRCCGTQGHTEEVASVCTYLHAGKENAALICKLMNEHNGVRDPQPVIDVETSAQTLLLKG